MRKLKLLTGLSIVTVLLLQTACGSAKTSTATIAPSGDAGTGKSTDSAKVEKVKLSLWDFHADAEKKYFEDLAAEYNKANPNVEIAISISDQGDYTTTKLPTAFANDAGPDLFFISPGDFVKFAKSGTMLDLNPYFEPGIKDDFLPSALDAVTYDGKVMAMPFELELLGLYYNKEMLEKANVAVPKTWDELRAAAKKLTTDTVAGLVIPPDKGPYFNFIWYPFLWQQGGNVLSADGTQSTFNTPEAAKALDVWGSFFKDRSSPAKLQLGPWEIANLGNKTAAMQIIGTWAVNALETTFKDVPIGLAPIPIPSGGKAATDAGGWKLAANARGKHVDEAAKFIMWAFGGKDTSHALKWGTEVKFAYSPRKSVVEAGKEIYSKGLRKVFTDEIYSSAIPEPRYPSEVLDIVGDAMQNVMFKNVSGADAAKEADAKIAAFLKK
ncbi:sugar ABC transporter substrate-binding protein [Paenibacillus psychroresistens]|uniref:Sugar ABC transporter substrate-binding protein n=1 Tax=Paenibacillus psychroresistens TaxID=1778678 RepID=A0A6B8RP92_9BACL|nr:sugar ABC transporter substrate-binding protein [Paenibacillus psychroresistens]QGQ98181.1 sugar ABC transporter substrate-binding protein [Paenibacillus psychroresistens]